MNLDINRFIAAMPKCELHVHVEGTLEGELKFPLGLNTSNNPLPCASARRVGGPGRAGFLLAAANMAIRTRRSALVSSPDYPLVQEPANQSYFLRPFARFPAMRMRSAFNLIKPPASAWL